LVPGKTRETNNTPLYFPMNGPLKGIFLGVKCSPINDDGLWFGGFSADQVKQSVSRAFTKAGIPWGSFIQFRHFGACYLLGKGERLEELKDLMHHKDIKTTQIYARVTNKSLEKASRAFDDMWSQVGTNQGTGI